MAKSPAALSELVSDDELDKVLGRVALNGGEVDAVVETVVNSYCEQLDSTLYKIHGCLLEEDRQISDPELYNFIAMLPVQMYYACTAAENLGVRDDIARLLYREAYNNARKDAQGTVADKDAEAQQHVNAEALTAVIYNRAARMVKVKLEMAQETLNSLKKIVSARMVEREVNASDMNGR